MQLTDHNALLLRAAQPMADWVNDLQSDAVLVPTDLEPDLYLLPGSDDPEAEEQLLSANFVRFFENALQTWTDERQHWPERRDWETFSRWFSWEFVGMVWQV